MGERIRLDPYIPAPPGLRVKEADEDGIMGREFEIRAVGWDEWHRLLIAYQDFNGDIIYDHVDSALTDLADGTLTWI